ncbi:hypothetical protein [Roseibium sp.]
MAISLRLTLRGFDDATVLSVDHAQENSLSLRPFDQEAIAPP